MKKVLAITIFLILCICINTVYAADVSVTLNKTATEIKKGEEITVSITVNDINAEKGVDTLIATLNYDGNIFEKVEKQNILAQNDWGSLSYRADTGKMIIQRNEPMKIDGTICSITLKAKKGATIGNSSIKLLDINLSDGTENYFPANVETTICIKDVLGNDSQEDNKVDVPTPTLTPTSTPTPTSAPEATQKPTNNITPTSAPEATQKPVADSTVKPTNTPAQKPTVLPKAGDGVNILAIISGLIVITVVTYIKIRKYKEI